MATRTPLYSWHVNNNATIEDVDGWSMPLHYGNAVREHKSVRFSAGAFDLCNVTRIRIRGRGREKFLEYMTTNDLGSIEDGQIQHSLVCNKQGGIVDNVVVYKSADYLLVCGNALNREVLLSWFNQHKQEYDARTEDSTASIGMFAIQGPKACAVLQNITPFNVASIAENNFVLTTINGVKALVGNISRTGETGYEIFFGALYIQPLWEKINEVGQSYGLVPIGLDAQDTLRIEAGLPKYENELDSFTTPTEARLDKWIELGKKNFNGKTALITSTSSEFSKRLICFELVEQIVPAKGNKILSQGLNVGYVTSGCHSPSLDKGIGMGYVDQSNARIGQALQIDIGGKLRSTFVVKGPFCDKKSAS